MGDLLDIGIKSAIGGSVYDNQSTPTGQLKDIVQILEPYKKQIDGAVEGNHEWRLYKETGVNITELLCMFLNVPYMKHSGTITYAFEKRAYNINFFHGKGAGSVGNALAHTKGMANKVFADVYLMGHVHATAHTKRDIKSIDSRNNKIDTMTQYFCLTGHSLEYDESYAEQMNLEINTKGFPLVILHGMTPRKFIEIID